MGMLPHVIMQVLMVRSILVRVGVLVTPGPDRPVNTPDGIGQPETDEQPGSYLASHRLDGLHAGQRHAYGDAY